jgi:alanine racemase
VHFKVDTGLTRLGAPVGEAPDRYRRIRALPGIEVDGIFTHFARAEESDRTTDRAQMASFLQVIGAIGELPRLVHAAASGGVAGIGRVPQMTAIRPGLSVYGVHASAEQASALALRPALTWRSEVLRLARVPKGTGVSYGHEYRLPRDGVIATVPVGYGDGLARAAAKRGGLLIRGRRVPLAGRVAMDLVMLDVTGVAGVREGDEAVIIGEQEGARQSADDLAAACGTISYEVLTAIRRRVPRRYFRGGRLVATRTLAEGYRER